MEERFERIRSNDRQTTELQLHDTTIPEQFVSCVSHNTILLTLSLSNLSIEKEHLEAIGTIVNLEDLVLKQCGLTPNLMAPLASNGLKPLTALQQLNLSDNPKIGPRGCQQLSDYLGQAKHLVSLDLSNIKMSRFGAQALQLPATLQQLDLSHNEIGQDGIWKLTESLSKLPLHSLNVSYNNILDDGCLEVAHVLQPTMTTLHLSGNNISDFGISKLSEALRDSNLEELYLNHNQIGDEGITALSENALSPSLGDCTESEHEDGEEDEPGTETESSSMALQVLDLSFNRIGNDGCMVLAEALAETNCLTTLDLSHNDIGDEGAGSLVELLDDMTHLRNLPLQGNPISSARYNILDMLLKHRSPSSKSLQRHFDESDSSGAQNFVTKPIDKSSAQSPAASTERLNQGRKLLQTIMGNQSHSKVAQESNATLHEYLKTATQEFDDTRVQSYGSFGPLFLLQDKALESSSTIAFRLMILGEAGQLQMARDAVIDELLQLRCSQLFSPVVVTTSPSEFCTLYDLSGQRSLTELLAAEKSRKEMNWSLRVLALLSLARALQYLHSGGCNGKASFHGDVQPINLYYDGESFKLTDAGLSRILATDRKRFASGDVVFGTRGYRCPRYERGSCRYDSASDMFSFGVVVSELLTGKLQHSKNRDGVAYDAYYDIVLTKQPIRTDELAGEPPKAIVDILGRTMLVCMSSGIAHRPKAQVVATALDRIAKT